MTEEIKKAASIIKEGGIVAFPTETVYGIGADATNQSAVQKIYQIKGRPSENPLIVHITSLEQLHMVVTEVSEKADKLIKAFWPGPLTIIFDKQATIANNVTAGRQTVAVRMPSHPVALEFITACRKPICAPSANPSGRPSATSAAQVKEYFGDSLFLLDGGVCEFGVESTVIDVRPSVPVILRKGAIPIESITDVIGEIKYADKTTTDSEILAPGMSFRHYAPKTPLILIPQSSRMVPLMQEEARKYESIGNSVVILCSDETSFFFKNFSVVELGSEKNLQSISKHLFSALGECDKLGKDVIICQSFLETGLGTTIMDRLRRAAEE